MVSDVTALACVTQLEGADTGDFEAVNAAAFLLSTESSKTIFIAVKDDDLPEADETFTFNLTLQVCAPDACAIFYFAVLDAASWNDFLPLLLLFALSSLLLPELKLIFLHCHIVLMLPLTILNPKSSDYSTERRGWQLQ